MSITLLTFDSSEICIPVAEAMRYMGINEDLPEIKAIAEDLLPKLRAAASPKVCYAEYPVVFEGGSVKVGGITSDSASLRRNLEGCRRAYIFAATVGLGVDRLISKYSRLAPSKAVILGALGSAMIESVCDLVCHNFGNCIRPRFSPGYGGFDLSAQRDIGELLDTKRKIGLYFNDSLMMIPEKSVTAVVGILEK